LHRIFMTWLDVAGNWAARMLPSDAAAAPFTEQQQGMLKLALEECFKVFAANIDSRLKVLEDQLTGYAAGYVDAGRGSNGPEHVDKNPVEAATCMRSDMLEAAHCGSLRTRRRKQRRDRMNSRLTYKREALMQLRPSAFLETDGGSAFTGWDALPDSFKNEHVDPGTSYATTSRAMWERVSGIELSVSSLCQAYTDLQSCLYVPASLDYRDLGIKATVLAQRCDAVIIIQHAWRRYHGVNRQRKERQTDLQQLTVERAGLQQESCLHLAPQREQLQEQGDIEAERADLQQLNVERESLQQ